MNLDLYANQPEVIEAFTRNREQYLARQRFAQHSAQHLLHILLGLGSSPVSRFTPIVRIVHVLRVLINSPSRIRQYFFRMFLSNHTIESSYLLAIVTSSQSLIPMPESRSGNRAGHVILRHIGIILQQAYNFFNGLLINPSESQVTTYLLRCVGEFIGILQTNFFLPEFWNCEIMRHTEHFEVCTSGWGNSPNSYDCYNTYENCCYVGLQVTVQRRYQISNCSLLFDVLHSFDLPRDIYNIIFINIFQLGM